MLIQHKGENKYFIITYFVLYSVPVIGAGVSGVLLLWMVSLACDISLRVLKCQFLLTFTFIWSVSPVKNLVVCKSEGGWQSTSNLMDPYF